MGIATSLQNLGETYLLMKKYNEAEKSVRESLIIYKEIGSIQGVAEVQFTLGKIFTQTGREEQAKEHYYDAIRQAFNSDEYSIILKSLFYIAKYLNSEGRLEKCLEIIAFLSNCEKIDEDLRDRVNSELNRIKTHLPLEIFNTILKKIETKNLKEIVEDILDEQKART